MIKVAEFYWVTGCEIFSKKKFSSKRLLHFFSSILKVQLPDPITGVCLGLKMYLCFIFISRFRRKVSPNQILIHSKSPQMGAERCFCLNTWPCGGLAICRVWTPLSHIDSWDCALPTPKPSSLPCPLMTTQRNKRLIMGGWIWPCEKLKNPALYWLLLELPLPLSGRK